LTVPACRQASSAGGVSPVRAFSFRASNGVSKPLLAGRLARRGGQVGLPTSPSTSLSMVSLSSLGLLTENHSPAFCFLASLVLAQPKTTYYWQVDEIEADGTTIYTGDIWSFKTPRPGTGTILLEIWGGLSGNAVSDLTGNVNYPHNPMYSLEVMSFEALTDLFDAFGGRLHGYLHPETSGDYTFWIASDDDGELWLSTDESPANAVNIAGHTGWTNPRQWDWFGSQQSEPISLTGGEKYYIMALYKEGWGGDNCAVAWEGPDSPMRAVIHGYYLSPFVQLAAYSPDPADGITEVKRTPTLSWSAGKNTASVNGHELYFSGDVNAVNDRIAEKVVLSEPSYFITTKLDVGKTYYWCVDEVEADGITRHSGDVWSFTVTTIPGRR